MSSQESKGSSKNSRRSIFMSPQHRKQALRSVLDQVQTIHGNVRRDSLYDIQALIAETDQIYDDATIEEKVNHQEEVLMDSEVMAMSSQVIKSCTEELTKECNIFNATDFTKKLLEYVNALPDVTVNELNWSLLESEVDQADKGFKVLPVPIFLLDSLSGIKSKAVVPDSQSGPSATSGLPEIQKKKRKRPDVIAALRMPEQVTQVEKEETNLEVVENIRKIIKRTYKTTRKPIDFFKLILDPTSFGKTIENCMHVSFLACDGKIKMTTDDEGLLVVIPSSTEMIAHVENFSTNDYTQHVISLDAEQWRMLNDAYRLTEPMISSS